MSQLLLEIGVEELPASFVHSGLESLEAAAHTLLTASRLAPSALKALGTPRRLALLAEIPARQPDREETVTGPPWGVAFKEGAAAKAAAGFAKKNGVGVDALVKLETPKGEYVAAHLHEPGRSALEVLPELLVEICGKAHFRKSMRWGEGDFAFGRPIHWLVALLDDAVVPATFAGVRAGRESRGHRFLSPAPFALARADSYVARLEKAHVLVDVEARTARMHQLLDAAAAKLGGVCVPDAHLSRECASMVEEPFVVPGTFDEGFLSLPDEVVVSVMRDHQFYFAVRDAEGTLMPRYLNVVNTAKAPEVIAKGNDRVLRARLADARFFVDEDRKSPLASRLEKLETVTFQKKLGTVAEKVARIRRMATFIAENVDGVDVAKADEAARLCKADLETLIVFEFPELQGKMGRFYAQHEGIDPAICDAIAEHYQPAGADDAVAPSRLGAIVGVADRLDTLAGAFSIGQKPSSSADPFGLRRAALGVIRTALEGPIDVYLSGWVGHAVEAPFGEFDQNSAEGEDELLQFFRARLRAHYKDSHPGDLVEATLEAWRDAGQGSLRDLDKRMEAVAAFRQNDAFEALAIAFKRAFNIAKDEPAGVVDAALLTDGAERDLVDAFSGAEPEIRAHYEARRYEEALALIGERLREPIDRFFDDVLVMAEDDAVRKNRLRLLRQISDRVTRIVHFHRLST